MSGIKYDDEKQRYDLVPPDSFDELVKVFTMGAKKYEDRNWEKGMSWGKIFAAGMRHAWKFWRGEKLDPESGLHHLAHATWNMLALLTYDMRGIGVDTRYIKKKETKIPCPICGGKLALHLSGFDVEKVVCLDCSFTGSSNK